MKKRARSLFLALALCLGLTAPAAMAAEAPAVSRNMGRQDQTDYSSSTVKSYLFKNEAGGLTRVEYVGSEIVVEDYSSDFAFQSGRSIPMELSIWGGFFAGADYNFFVFGQRNPDESDSTEVIRVVKYSKDWERLDHASLKGANTTVPFSAGSLRMDEYGGELYIRTCHEMYTSDDGLNHQASLTLCVDQERMTALDSQYDVRNNSVGYVSHSFNQFVLVDQDGNIVTMDHGDAYPRAAVLMKYSTRAGNGKFSGRVSNTTIQAFPGQIGENTTGASLGGLAETDSGYVAAYNDNGTGSRSPVERKVYLAYVPKSGSSAAVQAISAAGTTTPQLVSTGLDGGYVLWNGKQNGTGNDTLYYADYNRTGRTGAVQTAAGSLSDCAPVYYNGRVVWYVTNNSAPVFYTLDEDGVTRHNSQEAQKPTQPEGPGTQGPDEDKKPTGSGDLTLTASGNSTAAREYAVLADGRLVRWKDKALLDTGYQAVSFAENRYMGLKTDGTLWAWGEWYSLSDHTIEKPVKVLSNVKQISGYLALKKDGSVWSPEPLESMNQKQDGIFYQVIDGGVVQISNYLEDAGMAVTENGTLYSWGSNWSNAALGRSTEFNTGNRPAAILEQVSYVNGHFAIRKDGSLWSWGSNTFGTVGDGGGGTVVAPVKVMEHVVGAWVSGEELSAVLTSDGTLWTWGSNSSGELGYPDFDRTQNYGLWGTGTPYQSKSKAVSLTDVVQVTAGRPGITLALRSDGTLWAAGGEYGSAFVKVLDGVKIPNRDAQLSGPGNAGQSGGNETAFTDVPASAWYAPYANAAAKAGLMKGTGNGKFSPMKTLSLAEVIYRWYQAGITVGDQKGNFNGNSIITRSETAVILCRLAGLTERA